jgi:beta-lactamase superfamily II metal-dependent hydrolase
MEFSIDFIYVGDGDAIIVWGREAGVRDVVFFIDGGDTGNGEKVVRHYRQHIKPHLLEHHTLVLVNSHPHADHINGLIEIVEAMGLEFKYAIYNDPVECITTELRDRIYKAYLNNEEIDKLNALCELYDIKRYSSYSDIAHIAGNAFQFLSPSQDFYVNLVQQFTDVDFLKQVDFTKKPVQPIDEVDENLEPCVIVDAVSDQTPENLSGTIIQLTDGRGRRYLLTSDAGVDSFDYVQGDGINLSGFGFVQLPHHGSRRNINAAWLKKFNTNKFFVSAVGDSHHPRKAVINCIKRNIPDAKIYSTHSKKMVLTQTTDKNVFPDRGWGEATSL